MKTFRLCWATLAVLSISLNSTPGAETTSPSQRAANLQLARQLNQAFVQVAQDVSPSVVVITVLEKPSAKHPLDSDYDDDDPLEQFRQFLNEQKNPQPATPQKTTGQGSGIIIRANGYILTNRHVVEDADSIEVRLQDGRTFMAEVRGVDAPADVAVIKIDAHDLPVAKLADSDQTQVGEFAIAIGAPFALDYSVTFGHVSAKDRSDVLTSDTEASPAMMDQNFIQTDANINPGNSGGPLVNIEGEVIGINTLIRGLHTGIGFAIPINLARQVADKLIAEGKFTRSWLGISIKSLRELPAYRGLINSVQDGVVVQEISPHGPAAKSNLRPGDIITSIDGKTVITSQQLKDEIRSKTVGEDVTLEVFRKTRDGEKQLKVILKPSEWVDKTGNANSDNSSTEKNSVGNILGLSVKTASAELARKYNVDLTEGVIVTAIDSDGLAADTSLQEGDIITSIDERPTLNLHQFAEAVRHANIRKGAIIHFVSDGTAKFDVIKEGAD
jgi:serine protease Do